MKFDFSETSELENHNRVRRRKVKKRLSDNAVSDKSEIDLKQSSSIITFTTTAKPLKLLSTASTSVITTPRIKITAATTPVLRLTTTASTTIRNIKSSSGERNKDQFLSPEQWLENFYNGKSLLRSGWFFEILILTKLHDIKINFKNYTR